MQNKLIITTLFVIGCAVCITAVPLIDIIKNPNIVIQPDLHIPILKLCTFMGGECTNTTICCKNTRCGYTSGYAYPPPTRCCGFDGATGCQIVPGTNGIGCCAKHYCELIDAKKIKLNAGKSFTKLFSSFFNFIK